ncbi:MAG: MATE family efflux transporter [Gammaproteobacteria bacterium]|nr:MATE family efflux transporter [Gammaproteobacteria bacterium]MBT5725111.1 MATE family efflux transporter [Gammaproteobacteria bacterium]MBT6892043.1 MATE family efflux transporter [Gammaproteobacteria bacterium]
MAILDLTKGAVGAQLTRMTIPYFLGISSMILASMIETIYIGILGAKELAAYSFMFPVIMALTSISMGVGIGASSLIARAEGEGNREQVKKLATHTVFLTLALTLVLSFSTYFYLEFFYAAMGAEGEVLQLVVAYAEIWVVFGLVSFTIPMVTSTVLRALGIAKLPGYIMTITSGVQLVVSPVLIFGLFGVPAQGLLGSAYGFLIIGFIRIIAFGVLVARENILLTRGVFSGWLLSARAIMHIALPSMLSSLIGPISIGITIALLAAHGDVIVAAFGVVSRIEMLVTMILGALASSVAPFVGQNWGAKQDDRVQEGLSIAYRFCLFWGVLCFIVLGLFGGNLVGLINDDEQLIEAAGWFMIIVPISFGLMGIGQVAASVFIALGKPMPPTVLSILRTVVVYIPMAIVFDRYWGYIGIFISLMVANVLFGVAAYAWGKIMLRKEILVRA